MRGITDIHYLIYAHPDLDAAQGFYRDFGMMTAHRAAQRLYLRGTASIQIRSGETTAPKEVSTNECLG